VLKFSPAEGHYFKEFLSMERYAKSLIVVILISFLAACSSESGDEGKADKKQQATSDTTFYFGARIIPGDGSPAMEEATFIVSNGKFTAVGKKGDFTPPKGSGRVDLSGRTLTPIFFNLQAQPGLSNGPLYGPKNYSRESVMADLDRYAYYGIMGVLSGGTDDNDLATQIRDDQKQGKANGARLFSSGRGIVAKGGGPAGLGNIPIAVSGESDARKAVADQADKKVDAIKLWMDDGEGKGAKLKADAYTAAIDEAHKHNLKVVAEVFDLSDAKDLVKAGVDGFVTSIRDREADDQLISAMKEKNVFLAPALTSAEAKFVYADKPNWLGEQTMREAYPAQLSAYLMDSITVNKFKRNADLGALRQEYATAMKNLKKLADGGVKIALGTNSGSADTYPGYFDLREMIAMAEAGMQPADVIKAATSVPAAFLGDNDHGTIAVGKAADFLSMPNSPLEKMTNIKDVGSLYLKGAEVERSSMIQNITINVPKITEKDRAADAAAEAEAARLAAEAKLPHYGKFVLGSSAMVRSMAVPTPKGSKADIKPGPPDRITVSMKGASASELHEFYAKALPTYKWNASGNCWQRQNPISNKGETLCVESANNSAAIQITEK
jgi:imidazolonepropionase-like amidohydrolase